MSTALSDQVKIAALNTEHPGHFADLIAANLNLQPRRPAEAARNHLRPRAAAKTAAPAQPRAGGADAEFQNPERRRLLHRQDPARFFSARTNARHPARTRRQANPERGEIKSLREKIEQTPMPDEARKAAEQELERLQQTPPAAAEYGVGAQLSRLDFELAVGKIHRGQAGFEGGGKNSERAAFRPGQSQGPAARISRRHQTPQANQRADSLPGRPARRRQNLPRQKRGRRARAASSRAFRSAACATKRRFAATAARMSARCPDGSSRRCAASKAATRSFCWTNWTRSARIFAATRRRRCWKCSTRRKTTRSPTITSICRSTLSRVLFIATANWLEPIHPALRDRLEVIELPSYTESEKLQIAKRYLVPRQIEEHGLTRQDVKVCRRRAAQTHPRIHPRSRRAPVGTRNRRAVAQGHAQNHFPKRHGRDGQARRRRT